MPGSELREAYLPQEMLKVGFGLTDNVTVEGIGIFDWNRTQPEPVGTYFSSNDFVPRGGEEVFLGFGAFSDQGTDFTPLGGPFIENFQAVPRGPTIKPSDSGQYGVALRWFMPDFAQGTEFGFYFVNYHSKLPLISGRTGTQAGLANSLGTLTAAIATAQGLASGLPLDAAVAHRGQRRARTPPPRTAATCRSRTAAGYATIAGNTALGGGSVAGQATALATHEYAQTARYFTEYPEDIQLFGVSFNTQLGTTGIALQGEVSYRQDVPLQFDDVEVLFAALTPFEAAALARAGRRDAGDLPPRRCRRSRAAASSAPSDRTRSCRAGAIFDVWQGQMTATKAFPPMLGAAQLVAVVEAGYDACRQHAEQDRGRPDRSRACASTVRALPSPATPSSPAATSARSSRSDRFADASSWGYRAALRLDYLSLIGAWNFSPRFVWSHDVDGTTPGPGGNFVDGRTGATFGVLASYQSKLEFDVSYTDVRRRGPLQRAGRPRLLRGERSSIRSDPARRHDMTKLKHILGPGVAGAAGVAALANAAVTAQQAARLGADLTPMGAEKAGNAAGTIPGVDRRHQVGGRRGRAGIQVGRPPSRSVRRRQAALQDRRHEHGEVRGEPDRGAQGAARRLQGQLLHERLSRRTAARPSRSASTTRSRRTRRPRS